MPTPLRVVEAKLATSNRIAGCEIRTLGAKCAAEIRIPLDEYPHIRYWVTLRQALAATESSELEPSGRKSLPRVVLVFDERCQLLGIQMRHGILRGLQPDSLKCQAGGPGRRLFDVKVDVSVGARVAPTSVRWRPVVDPHGVQPGDLLYLYLDHIQHMGIVAQTFATAEKKTRKQHTTPPHRPEPVAPALDPTGPPAMVTVQHAVSGCCPATRMDYGVGDKLSAYSSFRCDDERMGPLAAETARIWAAETRVHFALGRGANALLFHRATDPDRRTLARTLENVAWTENGLHPRGHGVLCRFRRFYCAEYVASVWQTAWLRLHLGFPSPQWGHPQMPPPPLREPGESIRQLRQRVVTWARAHSDEPRLLRLLRACPMPVEPRGVLPCDLIDVLGRSAELVFPAENPRRGPTACAPPTCRVDPPRAGAATPARPTEAQPADRPPTAQE